MIDVLKLRRIEEVMGMVSADCEREAHDVDRTPFTPLGVGTQFGNMLAEIRACAEAVKVIAGMLADEKVAGN